MTNLEARRSPFRVSFEGIPQGASQEAFILKAAKIKNADLAAAVNRPDSAAGKALRENGAIIKLHCGLRIDCPIEGDNDMSAYQQVMDWMDYIIQFGIILRQHHGISRMEAGPARNSMLNNMKTLPMDRKVRMKRLFGNDIFARQTELAAERAKLQCVGTDVVKREQMHNLLDLHLQTLQDISVEIAQLVNMNVEPDHTTVDRLLAIMHVKRSFDETLEALQLKAVESQMAEELETDSRVLPTVVSEELDPVPAS